jgi:hypothetical protein
LKSNTDRSRERGSALLTIAALIVPLALCVSRLGLDLWYDEAYTLEFYVSRGFREIITTYIDPNNHVFYSLILRPFYMLSDADGVLRLPSLLSSAATLLLVSRLAARHVSPAAAALVVLWLGLNQMFLIHTMQVRGYSLSMSLGAALFAYAVRPSIRCRWFLHVGAIAGMACLLYTIPTNLLFLGPLCAAALVNAWLTERRFRLVAFEGIRWAIGGSLALLFYSPILRLVLAQRGAPSDWGEGPRTLVRIVHAASRGAPWLWIGVALGLPLWWLRVRRDRPPRFLVLPTALALAGLGPFLLQSALRLEVPHDRSFCPILPIWALTGGWLLWEMLEAISRAMRRPLSHARVALVGGLGITAILLPRVLSYPARLAAIRDQTFVQDGYFCYYAADFHPSRVVEYLKGILGKERSYMVLWDRRGFCTLPHYFIRAGVPCTKLDFDDTRRCIANLYYVVPKQAVLEDVSEQCGVSVEELRRAQEICNLGFYRVYRTPVSIKEAP